MDQDREEFEQYKERMKPYGLIPISRKWGNVGYLCKKCGHVFYSKRRYVNKHPFCPNCMRAASYGEQAVIDILVKNHISFQKEKKFPKLVGTGKAKLRFDFYIQNPKGEYFIIEVDGEQHYKETKWFGPNIGNDEIKNAYCIDNNIRLYRIRYKYSNTNSVKKAALAILYEQGFNVEQVKSFSYYEVKEKADPKLSKQNSQKSKKVKYYAIKNGRKSNVIVTKWSQCRKLVYGYSNCRFKSFDSLKEAKRCLSRKNN